MIELNRVGLTAEPLLLAKSDELGTGQTQLQLRKYAETD